VIWAPAPVAPFFFDRLDQLLPAERSPTSTADFLLHELPPLIDLLAVDYEATTLAVRTYRKFGS